MGVKLRIKKYKSGTNSFYLDIYKDGNRHAEFIDVTFNDKDDKFLKKEKSDLAENIRAKRLLEIQSGQHGFVPNHKRKANFNDYYNSFLAGYERNDKRMYKYAYEKFCDFTQLRRVSASQINVKLIKGYREYLISKAGLSGETPHDYFRRFKSVLIKASEDGLISPMELGLISKLSISRKDKTGLKKQILTIDELRKLYLTPCGNEEVKRAFLFACFTGLGEAEIRKLTWNKIQNNKLILSREKTQTPIVNELPKSAANLIGKRGKEDDIIFKLPSTVSVNKDLKNWVKKAGIQKNISFYCGRHTFAVMLLMDGANLKTVADCLGHTTTAHTIKYLNYVDALKDKALTNLPEL